MFGARLEQALWMNVDSLREGHLETRSMAVRGIVGKRVAEYDSYSARRTVHT
jgi:hypothetical protein